MTRERAADKYDGPDMRVEKHWSEKDLHQMNERDWRIFREDFSIAYKGSLSNMVLPLRRWDEAELPRELRKVRRAVEHRPCPWLCLWQVLCTLATRCCHAAWRLVCV